MYFDELHIKINKSINITTFNKKKTTPYKCIQTINSTIPQLPLLLRIKKQTHNGTVES